ncbi:PD-(D/E)XK nuclease family protein, partial [Lactococcus lactis]
DYDDFVISGRIDVLRFDHENKIIEIIDWKTAASFEDIFDKNIRAYLEWYSHYREQLALYAWLVAQEFSDYTKLDYKVVGKIVGFTKKLPVNIKTIT